MAQWLKNALLIQLLLAVLYNDLKLALTSACTLCEHAIALRRIIIENHLRAAKRASYPRPLKRWLLNIHHLKNPPNTAPAAAAFSSVERLSGKRYLPCNAA